MANESGNGSSSDGSSNGHHSNGRLSIEASHDLRDALAVTKGWLEVLFRNWEHMDEGERLHLVAGALLGANRLAQTVDVLDGKPIDLTDPPHERMAEEFARLDRWPGR